jgi:hypothetical protein
LVGDLQNHNGTIKVTFGCDVHTDDYLYCGNFHNGKFSGEGKFLSKNSERYFGNFKKGKRSGNGTQYYAHGDKYEGNWKNGKQNGQGIYYWENGDQTIAVTPLHVTALLYSLQF